MHKFVILALALVITITITTAAPQWPYRDSMDSYYYGYQNNNKNYRQVEDDDERESENYRQDLQVANGQQPSAAPLSNNEGKKPVQVVETGSARPVQEPTKNQQQLTNTNTNTNQNQGQQPFVNQQPNKTPPAFPPASPPAGGPPGQTGSEDESEEDSDEEEEADEGNEEENEDESEEEDRRRQEPVVMATNSSSSEEIVTKPMKEIVANKTKIVKPKVKLVKPVKPTTIEALVPGYVTDQGEVLVPFDTVSGNNDKRRPITIIPDTSYPVQQPQSSGQSSSSESVSMETEPPAIISSPVGTEKVPSFFRRSLKEKQLYYSDSPPPGSIFTFDDDDNEEVSKFRQDEAEDDDGEESEEEDDLSEESSEDEEVSPRKPPLAFIKATGPSGEDDEAESLGIKRARYGFPGSRSPVVFAVFGGQGQGQGQGQRYQGQGQRFGGQGQRYSPYNFEKYFSQGQGQGNLGGQGQSTRYSPDYLGQYFSEGPGQNPTPHNLGNNYYIQQGQGSIQYNRPPRPYRPEPIDPPSKYYYRPSATPTKKTKVIPVANFDLSIEHDLESGELTPQLTPIYFNSNAKVVKNNKPKRPAQGQNRPVKRPSYDVRPSGYNRPVNRPSFHGNRPNRPNLIAVYNIEHGNYGSNFGTRVVRQRSGIKNKSKKTKRVAKQLKNKKVKKIEKDPLGILNKVHNKKN